MKPKIALPPALYECPPFWQKIVNDISAEHGEIDCSREIRNFLKTYNARFLNDASPIGIEFDTEEDFVIFKLRHM